MKEARDFIDYLRDILEHPEAAITFVAGLPDAQALGAGTWRKRTVALVAAGRTPRSGPPVGPSHLTCAPTKVG